MGSYYTPPLQRFSGSTLHTNVMKALQVRGIEAPTDEDAADARSRFRDEYLTEAARLHGTGYEDPMSRIVKNPSSWETRRGRDNAVAELANALLQHAGCTRPTRQQYLDALARAEERTGTRYRDDLPGRPYYPEEES